MPKTIDLGQFEEVKKNIKTEILFEAPADKRPPAPEAAGKKNKDVQIAFYLTKEDAAKLNIIHAKLQAESGVAISRADRVRHLVINFIEEHRDLLGTKANAKT